jgi:hypothetical protein
MKKTLFVAFSHQLTESQREGWDKIVTLENINPELHNYMTRVPANNTLEEVQSLAAYIVREAIKSDCNYFYMTGEPTLTIWANLYASQGLTLEIEAQYQSRVIIGAQKGFSWKTRLICVQSTTERKSKEMTQEDGTILKTSVFEHVQWRNVF